jgi:hypothetical protein
MKVYLSIENLFAFAPLKRLVLTPRAVPLVQRTNGKIKDVICLSAAFSYQSTFREACYCTFSK